MAEAEDIRPAIGIDLGTTNSRVGIWLDEENRFELISNDRGYQSTPSYVAFTETERLIGDAAKDQVSRNPVNTVFDVKRLIGRKFSDLGTDADKMHIQWPFKVARDVDDKPMIHVEYKGKEKVFSAEDVYSMILGKMKDLAEVYSGSVVNGASVSYPHCFTSAQRQATRNACSMAGLENVTLVSEPICAALAYTLKTDRPSLGEKKVMIFDLGGGSLDVTLFSIEEGVIEVKATSGDSQLGGEDFDLRLLHHFIQEIKQKYENDITSHPRVVRRLKKQVERVKLALSSEVETTIQIDSLLEDFNFYSSISRACFEGMNMDLFEKCIKCVEECLQRVEVDKADVYEVVLIGGSSRIPKVQELLAKFFNDKAKLNTSINPDEAVVCGAAARSGISRGCKAFADYLVVDVIPMSLGLETVGGAMHVMHRRNSSIPRSREQFFTTVHDDQPGIFIRVYEGENSQTCDNLLIATIELPGIPPAPRGVPQILVRFDVDADGILTVSAKDKTTGEKVEVYMGEVDITSSRVHHDYERDQGLPIQMYHPSLVSENPNDSPRSLRPHELSNTDESSPHEFCEPSPAYRSSIAIESRPQEFSEPPEAYESSVTPESRSQEISEPSPACEPSNTVESRSQDVFEPPQAFESSNNVESRSLEVLEPAYEPSNTVESKSQEFYEPPQAFESVNSVESLEVLEPPVAHGSRDTVEERSQEFYEPPQAFESVNSVESLEVFEPRVAHGSRDTFEERSQEFPEPPQAHESNSTVESRSQELSGPPVQKTAEPTKTTTVYARGSYTVGATDISKAHLNRLYKEVTAYLARETIIYVHDGAVGSSPLSDAKVRTISDNPSSKLLFRSILEPAPTRQFPTNWTQEFPFTVYIASNYSPSDFGNFGLAAEDKNAFVVIDYDRSAMILGGSAFTDVETIKKALAALTAPSILSDSSNAVESSSRVSLVQEILDTVHVLTPISDFRTHKRECSTFIRRVNMIVPLFEEFRDLELPLSEEVLTCFSSLKAALNTAKDLLLLCSKGSKLWLILEQRKVAEQFLLLSTALLQALDKLPDSLGISDEVREQVDLVHNQLKRSKGLEDAVDAQLNTELISILDETNERSPDQLTKLAESFKFDTASALRKESQALDGMTMENEPPIPFPVGERGFDQISGLLNDLRNFFSSEDLEQHEYSKPPGANGSSNAVQSSLQESSAPPPRSPYSSSNSMEGRSLEYSEPPQVNRDEKIKSQESSALLSPPLPSNSSNSLDGRSEEFSTQPPRSPYSSSNSVESKSLEYSELPRQVNNEKIKSQESSAPPTYKSSQSFEGRPPHEQSEAPQVYRPSKTFGGRPSEFSEPTHSSSSTPESRSQEFSEYSSKPEFPEHSPVQKVWNGLEGGPPEASEPLSKRRMSSSSESRRHEPSELSPVYKSSNASDSRRRESVELSPSYRSSSSSVVSSEEFPGSGPFRAHEGMQNSVSDSPELHRTATSADEPMHHSPRAENARSASCPITRTSDSIIEDVVKKYTWEQVLDMTNDLIKTIGKGGFGAVYLGKLENEKEVAVKILDASSQQGITEFLNEVNLLKRVNHVNLVRLLGYCLDEKQVLIYEFAEEGSIWDHLQVGGKILDWKTRLNIALQSACGLEYLHTGCHPRIIHRDIKSQNILLTKSFVAKVADFGLSKLGADQDNINRTHVTTMVKGTLGYLDPEYLKTGQLTEKSDVYSFGVVLLEIITGRKPIQNTDRKSFIGDWVEEHYNSNSSSSRGLKSVADPTLGGHFNTKALKLVLNVAKDCIQACGLDRPDMTEVAHVLRKALMVEHDEKRSSKFFSFLS